METIKAQKGTLVKYFKKAQWDNMCRDFPSHGYVMIGETPNTNNDVPEEILNHRAELKIKSLAVKEEVPGFEAEEKVEENKVEKPVKKTRKRKNYAD